MVREAMKKVFITGISGFAGSHLAEYLATQETYDVYGTVFGDGYRVPLIPRDHFISLDLTDREQTIAVVKKIQPEWIFHLAALSSPALSFQDPVKTMTNNIEAELNLFLAALEVAGLERILVVGSAEEYGKVAKNDLPINETVALNPLSPYAVSKIAQDFLGLQYFLSRRLPVIRVRPFNHTGERQTPVFVVPAFAKQIAEIEAQKIEPVMRVGNLTASRDFTDVKDMVRAYVEAMEQGELGDVYNLGSGRGVAIQEVLNSLLVMSSISIEIKQDPQRLVPADVPELVCDATKFIRLTGWKTEIPFQDTLKRVLNYWRQQV